jgi:hypothetical protein
MIAVKVATKDKATGRVTTDTVQATRVRGTVFCYHRKYNPHDLELDGYTITHTPTGYAVGWASSVKRARWYAHFLVSLGVDWSEVTVDNYRDHVSEKLATDRILPARAYAEGGKLCS